MKAAGIQGARNVKYGIVEDLSIQNGWCAGIRFSNRKRKTEIVVPDPWA